MTLVNHACFWIAPTDRQQRFLRRYSEDKPDQPCAGEHGYHNAVVRIEDGPAIFVPGKEGRTYHGSPSLVEYMRDPRWPWACACGYVFTEVDHARVHASTIYRADDGREMTIEEAPPGALWDATHWTPPSWHGQDGLSLAVKLPPGGAYDVWMIDGPSSDGGHWQRVGTRPPDISVTPSILTNKYHGFLTSGVLVQV